VSPKRPDLRTLAHDVDEILYWVWDPIGVNGTSYARGEYTGYVGRVVSLLVSDVPEDEKRSSIAARLDDFATDHMGSAPPRSTGAAVERLLDLYAAWRSGFR
jgi:hypothetical protein